MKGPGPREARTSKEAGKRWSGRRVGWIVWKGLVGKYRKDLYDEMFKPSKMLVGGTKTDGNGRIVEGSACSRRDSGV
jgi:hypothetical protein